MALTTKPLEQVRADIPLHEVIREDMVRVNILVPVSIRRSWKSAGVQLDKTVTHMIVEAMTEYINKANYDPDKPKPKN